MLNILMAIGIAVGLFCVGMIHRAQAFSADTEAALQTEKDIYVATKRKSGEWSKAAPIGNTIYIGSDFGWWKHLEGGAEVRMLIKGTEEVGWATPIIDDPDRSIAGFKILRPWTYKRAEWTGTVFVEVQVKEGENDERPQG